MEKKTAPSTSKAASKAKPGLRKMTVRDLKPGKTTEVKGGPLSGRQRCF